MRTITKMALAAALIATASIGTVENRAAQADPTLITSKAVYAASRIQIAFDASSGTSDETDLYPVAVKGDLLVPLVCFGRQATQAECPDVTFQVPPPPSTVVETRIGNTSILRRMDVVKVSGLIGEEPKLGRIGTAFQVVSEMPRVADVRVPIATKGDLPVSLACLGSSYNPQAGCAEMAYKGFTEPSFVVATSYGNTTTLARMDAMTVADVFDKVFWDGGQRESAVSQ